MGRNKLTLGIILLILIAGLFFVFKRGPSDSQQVQTFQQRFMFMQSQLNANVGEFQHSYQMAQGTHTFRMLYIDAMHLNMAASYTLQQTNKEWVVPTLKNKVAQANLQQAHDLYIVYIKALMVLSKNTVNFAQNSGFVGNLPPLTLPTTDDVVKNITSAYMVLSKPAK